MRKKINLFILLLVIMGWHLCDLSGQTWIRSYQWEDLCPGPYTHADAEVWNVIPAIGGGYLLQGHVQFIYGDIPAYEANVFWKIDENGDVVWRRTGVSSFADNVIVSNGTNRYYCLNSHQGSSGLYVYDAELNFLNVYGFQNINGYDCQLNDMLYDNDGLVFAGMNNTGQGIILKTDFQFDVVWQSPNIYTFGHGFLTVKPHNNGWVAVSDRILSLHTTLGDTLWTVDTYPGLILDCVEAENDSLYLLRHLINIFRIYQVNDVTHTLLPFSETLSDSFYSPYGRVILDNNGFIVLAYSDIGLLHKFSLTGDHLWSREYPAMFGHGAKVIFNNSNGNIIFCIGNNIDPIRLVKADSSGYAVSNEDQYTSPVVPELSCYPNPAASQISIKYESQDKLINPKVEIYNLKGQKILTMSFPKRNNEVKVDLTVSENRKIANGIYFYQIVSDKYKSRLYKFTFIK